MATASAPKSALRFGIFELDPTTGELRKNGILLKLHPQPAKVLVMLASRPNVLVTREELKNTLWGDDTFVDFEQGLNSCIRQIRTALSDDPDTPRFIQTIPRKGYRFIAPVTETDGSGAPAAATAPRASRHRRLAWLITVVAATAAFFYLSRSRIPPSTEPGGRMMLAVLPFQNISSDPEGEYLADGLTEEMIAQLGSLEPERLGVIARTSAMKYKGARVGVDQIGNELGVDYVVEGSIRPEADRVRVTAQLIRVKDQTHLWAGQYDRELSGVLAVQGEIAQAVADEIQLALGGHRSASLRSAASPRDYEAYDLYLKGQYFLNQRSDAAFEQAIAFFQQAAGKDPNFARAYAGLAHSYALIPGYGTRPAKESMSKARVAALKALEIDPSLPEAHTALGLIVQSQDWDWRRAEKEFRRAIELNPNYATAHHWYAEHLMWLGRFDEALEESEKARQLDPLSLIIAADNAAILYYSRQYDRAIEKLRSVLAVNPDFPRAFLIVAANAEKGRVAEALAFVEAHRRQISTPYYWAFLAHIHGGNRQVEAARHALSELLQLNRRAAIDPVMIAWACAQTGENEQALRWLEEAYKQHSDRLAGLKVNPVFDPLRGDARFQELMRRVGLAQ